MMISLGSQLHRIRISVRSVGHVGLYVVSKVILQTVLGLGIKVLGF